MMQAMNEHTTGILNLNNLIPDWSYLMSAPLSSSQGITSVFLVILASVFFLTIGAFFFHVWRAHRRISFIIGTLSDIKSDELVQQREQITVNMDGHKDCKDLWLEFDESLVASSDSKTQKIYNTIDAAHFFDTHTLARGMTESRLIAAIPGILTAIGVLGTFMGLTLGLGGLGEIGGGTTQHLKEGISGMIHASSIAFTTSFWGVLSSVLFNIIEKISESRIRRKINILQDRIDYLFPRLTSEKMLMDISKYSQSSDETMLNLAQKIGDRMQEAVLKIKDDISIGMAKALQEVLAPALGSLVKSAENLAHKQNASSELALEKIIQHFMDQFGQAGAKQGEMMRDSARKLQELIEKINAGHENSLQNTNAMDEKRQRAFIDVIEHINKQFKQFQLAGEKNTAAAGGVVQQQKDAIQALLEKISADQKKSIQSLEILDEKRLKALDNMFAAFQAVGEKNTQTTEGVVQQQKNVIASVQKVSDDLLDFASMIEGVIKQLSEAANEIKTGNQELSRTSQVMAGAVSDAARSNEIVSQSNQDTNQKLQGLLDKIESSCVSAKEVSDQIRASAEAGKNTFAELNQHQEGYRNALNDHVKELAEQLSTIMEQYAKEVGDQTHNRLRTWDEETMKYTTAMQGVINVMENLVSEMNAHKIR